MALQRFRVAREVFVTLDDDGHRDRDKDVHSYVLLDNGEHQLNDEGQPVYTDAAAAVCFTPDPPALTPEAKATCQFEALTRNAVERAAVKQLLGDTPDPAPETEATLGSATPKGA